MTSGVAGLLERNAQRAQLEGLLRGVAVGRGSVMLVEGPAGIGKTEVLRLDRTMAPSHRVRALQVRGGELEREFAFGVARQLFEPALVRATPAQREELLVGVAGRARLVLEVKGRESKASVRAPIAWFFRFDGEKICWARAYSDRAAALQEAGVPESSLGRAGGGTASAAASRSTNGSLTSTRSAR